MTNINVTYQNEELNVTYDVNEIRVIYESATASTGGGSTYTLPTATTSVLGGIIVGSGLQVTSNGTLSTSATTLPATRSRLGGIIVGNGLSVLTNGTLSVNLNLIPAGRNYRNLAILYRSTTGTEPTRSNELWLGTATNAIYTGNDFSQVRTIKIFTVTGDNVPVLAFGSKIILISITANPDSINTIGVASVATRSSNGNVRIFNFASTDIIASDTIPTPSISSPLALIFKPRNNDYISSDDIIDGSIEATDLNLGGTASSGRLLEYNAGQSRFQYVASLNSAQISDNAITSAKIIDNSITDAKISNSLTDTQKRDFRSKIDASEQNGTDFVFNVYDNLNSLRDGDFGFYNGTATGVPSTNDGFVFMFSGDQISTEISTGIRWRRDKTTSSQGFSGLTVTDANLPTISTVALMRSLADNDGSNLVGVARFTSSTPGSLISGLTAGDYVVARNGNFFIAVNNLSFYHAHRPTGNTWTSLTWHYKSYTDIPPSNLQRGDFDYIRSGMGWILISQDNENNHNISWVALEQTTGTVTAFGVASNNFVAVQNVRTHTLGAWTRIQQSTNQIADNAITNAKMADDSVGLAELNTTNTGSNEQYLQRTTNGIQWNGIIGGLDYQIESVSTKATSGEVPNANAIWFGTAFDTVYTGTAWNTTRVMKLNKASPVYQELSIGSIVRVEASTTSYIIFRVSTINVASNTVTLTYSASNILFTAGTIPATSTWTVTFRPVHDTVVVTDDVVDSAITSDKIATGSITNAKMADDSINLAEINTTNTGTQGQILSIGASSTIEWTDAGAEQQASDWNATTGVTRILNKPTLVGTDLVNLITLTNEELETVHAKLGIPYINYEPSAIFINNINGLSDGDMYYYTASSTGAPNTNAGLVYMNAGFQIAIPVGQTAQFRTLSHSFGSYNNQLIAGISELTTVALVRGLADGGVGRLTGTTPSDLRPANVSNCVIARNGDYFILTVHDTWYWANRPSGNSWTTLTWNYKNYGLSDGIPNVPHHLVVPRISDVKTGMGWVIVNEDDNGSETNISFISRWADNNTFSILNLHTPAGALSSWLYRTRTATITAGTWGYVAPSVPTVATSLGATDRVMVYNNTNTRHDTVTRKVLEDSLDIHQIRGRDILSSSNYQTFSSFDTGISMATGDAQWTAPSGTTGYLIEINPANDDDEVELKEVMLQGYQLRITFGTNIFTGTIVNITNPNSTNFRDRIFEFDQGAGFTTGSSPTFVEKVANNTAGQSMALASVSRFIRHDALVQELSSNPREVVSARGLTNILPVERFARQTTTLTGVSGTTWNNFNFNSPAIQILDKNAVNIKVSGSGVLFFDTSTDVTAIGAEFRCLYRVSNNTSFSGDFSVVPYAFTFANTNTGIFFRSKIASGGGGSNTDGRRFMDYNPTVFLIFSPNDITINNGQYVQFRLSMRKPSSDHPNLHSAYSWRILVSTAGA